MVANAKLSVNCRILAWCQLTSLENITIGPNVNEL